MAKAAKTKRRGNTLLVLVIAALVWFRLYGRTRRYGKASSKRYHQHAYRGRRR